MVVGNNAPLYADAVAAEINLRPQARRHPAAIHADDATGGVGPEQGAGGATSATRTTERFMTIKTMDVTYLCCEICDGANAQCGAGRHR